LRAEQHELCIATQKKPHTLVNTKWSVWNKNRTSITSISEALHEFSCVVHAIRVFLTSFIQSVKAGSTI